MKYQNWDTYTDEMKQKAAEAESLLDTHNGTTKDDLINIIQMTITISIIV